MNKIVYYMCIALILGFSSHVNSDPVYYKGTMKVKGLSVPAKATYQKFDFSPEPSIKIQYKLSGEDYQTPYMKDFGDKVIYKPDSIIIYNESVEKKQNYYFQGKEVSWFKALW